VTARGPVTLCELIICRPWKNAFSGSLIFHALFWNGDFWLATPLFAYVPEPILQVKLNAKSHNVSSCSWIELCP
jgi:hypothetical protein